MTRSPARVPAGIRVAVAVAVPAALLAACGNGASSTSGGGTSSTSSAAASSGGAVTVKTHHGSLGTYLTDGAGRTLYLFMADHGSTSTCSGACASAWPPLTTSGAPHAAGGARSAELGTSSRPGGMSQVTYAHHPLYYFAGDSGPGQTSGQGVNGFGAKWWVVSPAGTAITTTGKGSSGGYGGGSSY